MSKDLCQFEPLPATYFFGDNLEVKEKLRFLRENAQLKLALCLHCSQRVGVYVHMAGKKALQWVGKVVLFEYVKKRTDVEINQMLDSPLRQPPGHDELRYVPADLDDLVKI